MKKYIKHGIALVKHHLAGERMIDARVDESETRSARKTHPYRQLPMTGLHILVLFFGATPGVLRDHV